VPVPTTICFVSPAPGPGAGPSYLILNYRRRWLGVGQGKLPASWHGSWG